ncbi:MAG: hypothetical protein KIS66_11610 [Fimbriimonadaceae bacterium]|nr:hypothetical protein [Fimbriimonadaceae bacterium]
MIPVLAFALWASAQTPPEPVYRSRGDYDPKNALTALEITKIEGDYVPFYHEPAKPDLCPGSRITVRITVRNTGKTPLRMPDFVLYEANMKRPWMTTNAVVDGPRSNRVQTGGNIHLRGNERVLLKPGEAITLSHSPPIPEGPWNPLKIEARLALRAVDDLIFVGHRTPFRATLALNAPNYHAVQGSGVFKGLQGRPLDQTTQWRGVMMYVCEGPVVGGPVSVQCRIKRKNSNSPAIMGGTGHDTHDGRFYLDTTTESRGEIDWARGEFSVKVGCPTHGMSRLLTDANPSDDTMILSATAEGGSAP